MKPQNMTDPTELNEQDLNNMTPEQIEEQLKKMENMEDQMKWM